MDVKDASTKARVSIQNHVSVVKVRKQETIIRELHMEIKSVL